VRLRSIAQSRTGPASRVERARILLAYREDRSFFAVGRALELHHQTVQRSVERVVAEGRMAAPDDSPRRGREPSSTLEAKAWLVLLACRKAKGLGYPHELWTTRLLVSHAREHGPAEGQPCLAYLAQGTVCEILDQERVKPHKVRYYLEQRDPDFAEKMAEVLCVYRQVKILKMAAVASRRKPGDVVAIISYDEPGIQAIATTAADMPPEPGVHPTFAREHEYKRHGTVSLLAGIDLVTGKADALVKDRYRSREFIECLKAARRCLSGQNGDQADPRQSFRALRQRDQSPGRRAACTRASKFTFTPNHGSWLNLVEGFFSKLTRSVLRHIRVASKQELKDRRYGCMDYFDDEPSFKPGATSVKRLHDMIRISETMYRYIDSTKPII
jgi:hypothetical protein